MALIEAILAVIVVGEGRVREERGIIIIIIVVVVVSGG